MTYSEQHLGSIIRRYRNERGYTQSVLAEKMGITPRQVMYIENGQRLLHSCHPDDQSVVYATLQTLIERLNQRR